MGGSGRRHREAKREERDWDKEWLEGERGRERGREEREKEFGDGRGLGKIVERWGRIKEVEMERRRIVLREIQGLRPRGISEYCSMDWHKKNTIIKSEKQ